MHLLITGAGGYVGRAVLRRARQDGHRVTLLSSDGRSGIPWRLGEVVPDAALAAPVDAVIHLAHLWNDPAREQDDINIAGTTGLVSAARKAGVPRFVFASSISSRQDAVNRYGRVKHRTEQILDRPNEVSARIGLIYGGAGRSLWGLLKKITRLPLLPLVAHRQLVQPVHIDDVAIALLRLAETSAPSGHVVIAADPPISFGEFLRMVARHVHGRTLRVLPLPKAPLVLMLDTCVRVGLPVQGIRERVLGLVGITVQPAADDTSRLGIRYRTLAEGLSTEAPRPRLAPEAAALLRYVGGRKPSPALIRRFLRGWRARNLGQPVLSPAFIACPALLRLAEPFPGDVRPRAEVLRRRLFAATVMLESGGGHYAYEPRGVIGAWVSLLLAGAIEAALLVPRKLIARWAWK